MLLKLQLEITRNILSHLLFEDKLNLKATCRKLNDLITRAILYEDLNLLVDYDSEEKPKHKKALNTFLQKLIDNKFDGSVVKTLRVNMDLLSDHIIAQLSDLFPNIKKLSNYHGGWVGYSFDSSEHREFDRSKIPLIKWRETIEKVDLREDWHEIIVDLLHFEYPRLTVLHVISASFVFGSFRRSGKMLFFDKAPLLTTLALYDSDISLEIMELIHAGFPLLRTLKLIGMTTRVGKDTTLPSPITPANNMTSLELNYASGFNTDGVTLMYILIKYPKLKKLLYSMSPREDYSILTLDDFLYNRHGSEDAYEEALSRSKETYEIYSSLETMFFSCIPKSIRTLKLKMINMENAITALADSGTTLTVLDLFEVYATDRTHMRLLVRPKPFVEADILKKITKMTSLKTLKIPIRLPSKAFTLDTISLSITKLFINLYGKSISIESILYMFPSLEELYMSTGVYRTGFPPKYQFIEQDSEDQDDTNTEEMQPRTVYPKLRILHTEWSPIDSRFFPFVKNALPSLNRLKLDINLPGSRITKFDLSSYDVNNWDLSFGGAKVDCTIIMQNISKRLLVSRKSKTLKSVHQNNTIASQKELKFVEITVNRIKNFKICGFSIVKVGDKIYADCAL